MSFIDSNIDPEIILEVVEDITDLVTDVVEGSVSYVSNTLVNVKKGFSTLVPNQDNSNEYEVGKIDFEAIVDEKIINICQQIFNIEKCKSHRYKQMSDFLDYCLKLTDNILFLIESLNNLINEDSNYFFNNELLNDIESYFEKFRNNCESIKFFHKNDENANLLNDLYNTFNLYLEARYYESDFRNTEFIYSDIQLNWRIIKYNLLMYQKMKNNEYQKIMFPNQKKIGYFEGFGKTITNFFFPSVENTLIVRETQQLPLIENKIKWKGKEINIKNQIENDFNNQNVTNIHNNRLITSH